MNLKKLIAKLSKKRPDKCGGCVTGHGKHTCTDLSFSDSSAVVRNKYRPVTLLEELRIEASLVPNRRGRLYAMAADEIKKLRDVAAAAAAIDQLGEDRGCRDRLAAMAREALKA